MALRICRGCMVIEKWPSFCGYRSEPRELASLAVKDAPIDGRLVADQLLYFGRRSPLHKCRHRCGHLRRNGAPFAIMRCGCYPNGASGSLLSAEESKSVSLQLCRRMRKSHSVVVRVSRAQLWSNLGWTFPTLWLATNGQNRSLEWVQKNGQNGHRRRIFRRPRVAMCWQYVHSSTSRLPGRLLCADGLVAQLVHRARPIEGGVASQCVSCHARPVLWPTHSHSLALCGQDWSQNTMSVHEQGMCHNDVPLWSECSRECSTA